MVDKLKANITLLKEECPAKKTLGEQSTLIFVYPYDLHSSESQRTVQSVAVGK